MRVRYIGLLLLLPPQRAQVGSLETLGNFSQRRLHLGLMRKLYKKNGQPTALDKMDRQSVMSLRLAPAPKREGF